MQINTKSFMIGFLLAIGLFFFSGCPKKTSFPSCKNDADCHLDAMGKALNGICYMGKCEECLEDTDCTDLRQCINRRCEHVCQIDADCGESNHCEENICMPNCTDDSSCLGNKTCDNGRCVSRNEESIHGSNSDCSNLERIHFDFNKFDIAPNYRMALDKLAICLEKNAIFTIQIEGHADERGTPSYNMALSEKRANAAKEYLVQAKGIAQNRIKVLSYGEQKPLLDEKNEHAWQQNRRAEFVLENSR